MGAKITKVFPGGIGDELGIEEGDEIISINDNPLKDIFDYQFFIQESQVEIVVKHKNRLELCKIEKLPEEDLGVQFESPIFDGIKKCQNSCIFCFIDQLPKGLRPSLYLKDDDYRLSFLYGNYITLTNISEEELKRIIKYRLSPLYVSVHSTIGEIRLKLIRNKKALSILEKLSYLINNGINLNIQIVLIPDINDGKVLRKTIQDLFELERGIISLAIVPVGLTKYREGLYPLRKFRKEEIVSLIAEVEEFQKRFRKKIGRGFVYLADEFFLDADIELPQIEYYDTLSQIEDGVGMTRFFIEETKRYLKEMKKIRTKKKIGIITGVLGKKALERITPYIYDYLPGLELSFIEVKNEFFGENITVTGLLTSGDIRRTIESIREDLEKVFIPDIVLNDERVFLDDVKEDEFLKSFDTPVYFINTSPKALLENLAT